MLGDGQSAIYLCQVVAEFHETGDSGNAVRPEVVCLVIGQVIRLLKTQEKIRQLEHGRGVRAPARLELKH